MPSRLVVALSKVGGVVSWAWTSGEPTEMAPRMSRASVSGIAESRFISMIPFAYSEGARASPDACCGVICLLVIPCPA